MNRRKFFLSVVFVGMLAWSCKKDSANIQPKAATPTVLTGTWELRRNDFPQERGALLDYPPGNGNITIFFDTTFINYYVGYGPDSGINFVDSGTYYIKELPNSNPQLVIDGDTLPPRELFTINKDSLIIFGGTLGADGTVLHYVKID
jgi:hypothetical protein